jgi:hypothetical protein
MATLRRAIPCHTDDRMPRRTGLATRAVTLEVEGKMRVYSGQALENFGAVVVRATPVKGIDPNINRLRNLRPQGFDFGNLFADTNHAHAKPDTALEQGFNAFAKP